VVAHEQPQIIKRRCSAAVGNLPGKGLLKHSSGHGVLIYAIIQALMTAVNMAAINAVRDGAAELW
jgi:2C-methyl-D-erythritol 2,4-cyclodiphosphate synthase